jgi:hypothetical protein
MKAQGTTMKHTLTLLISLLLTPLVGGATYYVATDGHDINEGTTVKTPFRRMQVAAAEAAPPTRVVHDLTPLHDATRVLINPHKGWYHHFPDNHPNKYQIARDADLLDFPGMDHLYIRLAWAYLEPKEGHFDWAVIDRLIEKWTAHGLGIAFRISCKETSTDRIEQQFATPRWVMEAGAKGGHYRMGQAVGPEGPWEPEFDDPIFLAKLDRFLAAFAARYDGKPWLRYLDVGSIGDWGEGHCWAGSRKDLSFAVRKRHVDLHLKHFKRTQLVISDDYVHALNDPAERASLHQHILTHGISYRDDSILVNGYLQGTSDTFTVRSPEFFADAYSQTPTVFELEHYGSVKKPGNWDGRPDSGVAKYGKGKKGPDYFRGALGLLHATYIGYHGDAREWLTDNPELTKELLNKCGYWLFPMAIELPDQVVAGATVPFTLTLENRGVAPPYAPYELRVKLSGAGTNWVHVAGRADKSWRPGKPIVLRLTLPLPAALRPGQYQLAIGLFDAAAPKERPVEFAFKESARDSEGYYHVGTVPVSAEGALKVWYPVTITFTGKQASETEATFRDHRLDVTFSKGDKSFRVPGYFAADGNAAESSATSGNQWRVKFTPNEPGVWTYSVSFREGPEIAVPADSSPTAGKSAGAPDGQIGSFAVQPADPEAPGFYGKGMLVYVGEHYLQFQGSKEWFVKAGPGSPEDFFGYEDFDGTYDDQNKKGDTENKDTYLYEDHGFGAGKGVGLHRYLFHREHWKEGDPTWQGGKGKGIIGAINYLSEIGANTLYHIILTRDDDADNTWPWTDRETKLIYDVSKLDQWDIVYTHMDRKGINADLYLCEASNARYLNSGNMGTERSIYYREIVARFGHHLGLRYNIGEEHGLKTDQIKASATYLSTLDAYGHPVVSHSYHQLERHHQQFEPLLGFKDFHGACYQLHHEHHTEVIGWREKSAQAGHKWIVSEDESWPIDEGQIDRAEDYAWKVMTAGGEGMNLYIGYKEPSYNDIGLEDLSRMKPVLDYVISPAALFSLPQVNRHLIQMAPADGLVVNQGKNEPPFCFAKEGSLYIVYHKKGSDIRLDLSKQSGTFAVKWWNPRKSDGGGLQDGSITEIPGGGIRSLGTPPSDPGSSWAALVLLAN